MKTNSRLRNCLTELQVCGFLSHVLSNYGNIDVAMSLSFWILKLYTYIQICIHMFKLINKKPIKPVQLFPDITLHITLHYITFALFQI
jgi:hypothetical protein